MEVKDKPDSKRNAKIDQSDEALKLYLSILKLYGGMFKQPINIWVVVLISVSILLVLFNLIVPRLPADLPIDPKAFEYFRLLLYSFMLIAIGVVFLRTFVLFLNKTTENDVPNKAETENKDLVKEISSLTKQIENLRSLDIALEQRDQELIVNELKLSIKEYFLKTTIQNIEEELANRYLQKIDLEENISHLIEIRARLSNEIQRLTRRSAVNLGIGVIITLIAGVGLLYLVFVRPLDLTGVDRIDYISHILLHYIPRLSLIIFAEIFAFFFLRLYKNDQSDIKYFQNEITNVELKMAAVNVALASGREKAIQTVVEELSKTERNFLLKKDETTADLEKFKAENTSTKDILQNLAGIWKAKS